MGIELSDEGLTNALEGSHKLDHKSKTRGALGKTKVLQCVPGHNEENASITQGVGSSVMLGSLPPIVGEKLFLLILSREERQTNILGDLVEEYSELERKFGRRFATLWYYKQAMASVWPLLRKAAKWGLFLWAGELIRRLTH